MVLFWDCPPQEAARRARALRADLAQLQDEEFIARWAYRWSDAMSIRALPWSTDEPLPDPEAAREWLATMTLIRRFEERAGEMYARAKVGGFLHLSIGEEATIVGARAGAARRATT